jgi:hypothetical protein
VLAVAAAVALLVPGRRRAAAEVRELGEPAPAAEAIAA